tara:strand:+ start:1036 stop:1224 length:189 start_codon:yes stop_codon:yes gene_type:complete
VDIYFSQVKQHTEAGMIALSDLYLFVISVRISDYEKYFIWRINDNNYTVKFVFLFLGWEHVY